MALIDEQQKFMFSVFATTLKESSAASLYDAYAIEGDVNYGNGQNLHNAAKNGEHSCVENFHGDILNPHNINRLSCTPQSL